MRMPGYSFLYIFFYIFWHSAEEKQDQYSLTCFKSWGLTPWWQYRKYKFPCSYLCLSSVLQNPISDTDKDILNVLRGTSFFIQEQQLFAILKVLS